jgi:hypothetical protein
MSFMINFKKQYWNIIDHVANTFSDLSIVLKTVTLMDDGFISAYYLAQNGKILHLSDRVEISVSKFN